MLRGSVRAPLHIDARPIVRDRFGDIEAQVLSFEDCYAGKLVAALDRQHPRDLFDVDQLFAAEGLTRPLIDAFVVYLASQGRPMAEVLAPSEKDISAVYESEFSNMAVEPVPLARLLDARTRLVRELRHAFLPRHVEFLRSIKALAPDWSLDIFWLKDKSLEDSENLPEPDVLAQEIADDLQTALEQFAAIAAELKR